MRFPDKRDPPRVDHVFDASPRPLAESRRHGGYVVGSQAVR